MSNPASQVQTILKYPSTSLLVGLLGVYMPMSIAKCSMASDVKEKYIKFNNDRLRHYGIDIGIVGNSGGSYDGEALFDLIHKSKKVFDNFGLINELQLKDSSESSESVGTLDEDLINSYMSIANDPNCSPTAQIQALDKISKIKGAYRQNRGALGEDVYRRPVFNFNLVSPNER